MKADGFCYYFSGTETGMDTTEAFLKAGRKIKGVMQSYLTFRGNKKNTEWLIRMRKEHGVKVMIDSGAHAFIYAENIEAGVIDAGWHPINSQIEELMKDPDKFVHEYMDWLEANREAYDYAVEFDVQKIVGQEKVEAWREEFVKRGIPLVIVLHPRAGDTIDTLKRWKERGVTYFGRGEFFKDNVQDMKMLREMNAEGVKIHIFAESSNELGKLMSLIDSSDSSSWLAAGKLGTLLVAKGKAIENHAVKESPLLVLRAVQQITSEGVLKKEEVERLLKEKKYLYLNWYNMFEMQKWIDTLTYRPAYATQLASAEKGETVLPPWVNEKDKFGRPKSIYLQSRFNNYKSGVYAKKLQENALMCNTCVVGAKIGSGACTVYQEDAICYFTPYWKRLGAKTRNKEQIVSVLADLVGKMHGRLERMRMFEDLAGGTPDKAVSQLEVNLAKTLELLDKVANGPTPGLQVNMLNAAGTKIAIGGNIDDALKQLREEYGDVVASKIEKRARQEAIETTGEVVEEVINDK